MIATLAAVLVLQTPNTLTYDERAAGWKLLFDGKSTKGWHNFKAKGVKPGWQVKDGVLTSVNPENAGDIMTDKNYEWFELSLDFNMAKDQNSGVMFHVTEQGEQTWHTGPEIQIYDHPREEGVETTGYLYQLYEPPSGVEASKPAGEWNTMRILITPRKCETYLNGVKYYEYVLNSPDFKARVAKSKFKAFPYFAKPKTGSIAIQGDHGVISFRNIKVRPIKGSSFNY